MVEYKYHRKHRGYRGFALLVCFVVQFALVVVWGQDVVDAQERVPSVFKGRLSAEFESAYLSSSGTLCDTRPTALQNLDWTVRLGDYGKFPDGGFWPGGLAYNLCTKKALDLGWCRMDFARLREVIGPGPLFFDVMSAIEPRRCGHPAHKMTADDMGAVYSRLYDLAQNTMGGSASECGFDLGIRYLDYVNYLWHEIGFWKNNRFKGFQSGVFPVWELVYHGVVFYTSDRWLQNHTYGNEDRSNGAFDFGWGIYDRKEDSEKALKMIEFGVASDTLHAFVR